MAIDNNKAQNAVDLAEKAIGVPEFTEVLKYLVSRTHKLDFEICDEQLHHGSLRNPFTMEVLKGELCYRRYAKLSFKAFNSNRFNWDIICDKELLHERGFLFKVSFFEGYRLIAEFRATTATEVIDIINNYKGETKMNEEETKESLAEVLSHVQDTCEEQRRKIAMLSKELQQSQKECELLRAKLDMVYIIFGKEY